MRCTNCNAPVTPEEILAGFCSFCGAALKSPEVSSTAIEVAAAPPEPAVQSAPTLPTDADEPDLRLGRRIVYGLAWGLVILFVGTVYFFAGRAEKDRNRVSPLPAAHTGPREPGKAVIVTNRCSDYSNNECLVRHVVFNLHLKDGHVYRDEVMIKDPSVIKLLSTLEEGSTIDHIVYDPQSRTFTF